MLKNTVLFYLLIMVSCAGKKSENPQLAAANLTSVNDSVIVVGADQMENYLSVLRDKKVAIVANQTSVVAHKESKNIDDGQSIGYTHLVDTLIHQKIKVVKVFAPEHGFRGKADAGELVEDGTDKKTGLPLLSLHGSHKKPTTEQMRDIEIMVFDIQDVGVRFYTYISTLHYIMEACAENNIPLLILDRPNPNGNYVDGPTMEKTNTGFLGMHTIPLVHGMTIAEYAQMINGEGWLTNGVRCELILVPLKNYSHNSTYSVPIKPSPNLPNDQSITLYPSLGLFEGTTINAGRGTNFQFQRFGSPILDSTYFKLTYVPKANEGAKFPKHLDETCFGRDLSNLKIKRGFTLDFLMEAYEHCLDKSKFFNTKNFTAHAGTPLLQQQIEAGLTTTEIRASWQDDLEKFKLTRKKYLLYD